MSSVGGGRYQLLEPLGQGGMGTVYRGERVADRTAVAVKLLRADLALSEDLVKLFEREAAAAGRLGHPACVRVLEVGADEGARFLVMEHAAGEPLAQLLARTPRLPPARAVAIAVQILDGIGAAHREGIVHRDLKPENIMIDTGDAVKILDFGIARLMPLVRPDGEHQDSYSLTGGGAVVGTPAYLSPEQALGEPVDGRADLYAIGVMLHEMLAGRRPFEGKTPGELISAHLVKDAPPLAGVGEALAQVVQRALAKRRDERWQDAAAFRDALLAAPSPASAEEQPPTRRLDLTGKTASVGMARTAPLNPLPPPPVAIPVPGPAPAIPAPSARRSWLPIALVCAAALVAVLLLVLRRGDPTARIRADLAHGDIRAARAAAEALAREYPADARAWAVLGDALIADSDRARGLAAYREAIHLDPAAGARPDLLANLRAAFADPDQGEAAFRLAEEIGAPARAVLVDLRDHADDARLRRRASNALATILIRDKVKNEAK